MIYIEINSDDSEMINLYSVHKHKVRGKTSRTLWGVIHVDSLSELGLSITDLDNQQYSLVAKGEWE
jgi:hypothetical protein